MRLLTLTALAAIPVLAASTRAHAADEALSFRGSATWTNAYSHSSIVDDARNPHNALGVAEDRLVSQLKPTFKVMSSSLQLVARPRFTLSADKAAKNGGETDKTKKVFQGRATNVWSEAFAQWTMSESATLALGRQNFQWGAAESLNPSNRLVHETVENRSLLYDVTGRNIARLNLTYGKSWSTILMGEYEENKDLAPFRSGAAFESAGLIKNELSWNSGADYVGIVGGGREKGHPWLGEYLNTAVPGVDGLSAYADARHEKGSEAWYPVEGMPAVTFKQSRADKNRVYTLAVYGLKYDFEGGNTLRAEYVLNDAGYSKGENELQDAAFAVKKSPAQAPLFAENAERSLRPGLELPGKRYAFVSAYLPDVFKIDDLVIYLRSMLSLADKSTSSYASIDYSLKNAGTLLAAVSATPKAGELRALTSPTYSVGYKHLW